ncbi:MAG TPA: SMP-30/gluconolactonase/LRE family protein [Stellaceae bacterium]|nr:SMP-30/gluconolactonase/LRE family protein [Stellaceae bacterium]
MTLGNFTLTPQQIEWRGEGLSRPECVLAERDGTLWTSDNRGGVTRIGPDGRQSVIGSIPGAPNGLALERSGSILIANIEDGKLYRLFRDGRHEVVLGSFDGKPLGATNFVYCDPGADRVWITVSTRTVPRQEAAQTAIPDGYILVLERGVARLAAEGLCFTNEVRIDRAGRHLYVAETAKGRVLRLPLAADGKLGKPEVFGPAELCPGARVDGLAFDAEGNLWVTEVAKNGLYVIAPDGACRRIFEDPTGATVQFPASIAFAGPDLKTAYIGSIPMKRLATFRSPVAGEPLAHWNA